MSANDPRRALVTGGTGFVGRHLVHRLLSQGYQATVTTIPGTENAAGLPATILPCDIQDGETLARVLQRVSPHVVFHLAGLARGDDLAQLMAVNVLGTRTLLDAARRQPEPPTIIIPGSAAEYGLLADMEPVRETAALRPISAYGVSKAAQSLLAQGYALRGDLNVIIGRVFNIMGPGEPAAMLCGTIAAQVAAIEAGRQLPEVHVGNLSPVRDYLDVRDAVRALVMLAEAGQGGMIYNICSGTGRRVEEVVRQLLALSSTSIALVPDPARQRPSDIPHCVGDPGRLEGATQWRPLVALEDSLRATLAWWRNESVYEGSPAA